MSLTRSMGAVTVREKAPDIAPATAFLKASLETSLFLLVAAAAAFNDEEDFEIEDEQGDGSIIIEGVLLMFSFRDNCHEDFGGPSVPSFFFTI